MRSALAAKSPRRQIAQTFSLPAPVGGLNAYNALADMPPTDAVQLDNMIPEPDKVRLRKGSADHVTGFASAVESLMSYSAMSGTRTLFAASGTAIYNVTSAGAVGAAVQSGLTNARWQHVNFSNSAGGQFLFMVNGADAPRYWDGSAWTSPALTGLATPAELIHVSAHKNRLWFVRKNSFEAYYLATNAVAGALSKFDVASLFRLGGYLMATATITTSAGQTLDDYFALISSEGEVAVYSGTDPSSATTWELVGMYRIGRPIGRRCTAQYGTDVVIITADGLTTLQAMMHSDVVAQDNVLTLKIQNLINADVQQFSANFGWQVVLSPFDNQLLVNVPMSSTLMRQYVMHTVNKSWCSWSALNASCWELHGDQLYFGGATKVYKANTGTSDSGSNIQGSALQAYSYLGARGQNKHVRMMRPVIATDSPVSYRMAIDSDFRGTASGSLLSATGGGSGIWDTSAWDTAIWGGTPQIAQAWRYADAFGYAVAPVFQVATNTATFYWYATDLAGEAGGVL